MGPSVAHMEVAHDGFKKEESGEVIGARHGAAGGVAGVALATKRSGGGCCWKRRKIPHARVQLAAPDVDGGGVDDD